MCINGKRGLLGVLFLKKFGRKYVKISTSYGVYQMLFASFTFFYLKFSNFKFVATFYLWILIFISLTCRMSLTNLFDDFSLFFMKGDIGTMANVIHWELLQLPDSFLHWYVCSRDIYHCSIIFPLGTSNFLIINWFYWIWGIKLAQYQLSINYKQAS